MYMANEMSWCCRYDCGMFAIKYMEYWNKATLTHLLVEVSTTYPLYMSLAFWNFFHTAICLFVHYSRQDASLKLEANSELDHE